MAGWRGISGVEAFDRRGWNRGLVAAVWWNIGLLLLSVAALPFDHRLILGLNPWVKPIKFEVSVIVYLLTAAVLLAALGQGARGRRTRGVIGWGIGLAMVVENTIIAGQSLRGVRSHMNISSWPNAIAWIAMGTFIAVNTALVGALLALYLRRGVAMPKAVLWGARMGLAVFLLGSIEGVVMVARYGGHTVGAKDGGPGLPFANWSTAHGDLRVAHFFALHALQLFPLAGWAISRTRLPQRVQAVATAGFAAAYSAVVWLLFAQAIAGRALLRI